MWCIPKLAKRWCPPAHMLDEDLIDEIEALGVDEIKVRTALELRNPLWLVCQVLWPRSGSWRFGQRR
jgi:hypothetical protein